MSKTEITKERCLAAGLPFVDLKLEILSPEELVPYSVTGAFLQYSATQDERNAFYLKHWMSTDTAMASLACFARFLHSAGCLRAAGRTDEAQLQEANAHTVFECDILPENRW